MQSPSSWTFATVDAALWQDDPALSIILSSGNPLCTLSLVQELIASLNDEMQAWQLLGSFCVHSASVFDSFAASNEHSCMAATSSQWSLPDMAAL
jgi:hypothetical protein